MVVFMRPSKTPPHFGTPKQAKPGIIIIKQHTTPKPSLDLSVQELAAEHRIGIHAFAKPTIVADGSGVSIQSDVDDHHTEPIIIRTGSHEVQNTHYPIDSSRPTVDVIAIKPDNNAAGGVSAVTDIAHHMPGIHKGQPIDQSMTTIVQIKPDTGASGGAVAIVDQTVRNPAHASQTLASIVPDKGAGGNFKTAPNVIDQNIVQTISQAASVNRHQSNTENQISDLTNNNNDMGQKDLSRLDQNAEATPIPLPPKRLTNPPSIPTEPVEIKEEPTKPLEPPKPGEPGYGPPGASIEETNNLEPPKPGEPGYGPPGTARDTDSYVTTGTTRSQGLGYARKSDIQQDWKETYNKLYRRRYGLSP